MAKIPRKCGTASRSGLTNYSNARKRSSSTCNDEEKEKWHMRRNTLTLKQRVSLTLREAESARASLNRPQLPYRSHPATHMLDRVVSELRLLLREMEIDEV